MSYTRSRKKNTRRLNVLRYKVEIKMITYDGTKWLSTTVFAESMSECMDKIEQEYKLYDCLNYWVNVKELAAG